MFLRETETNGYDDWTDKEEKSHVSGPTTQISHARRAGEPSLLNNWAMLSGSIIDDLGEIKGVALWLLDRLSSETTEIRDFSGI